MSDQPKPVKIDITSSVIEKGIDLAKEFVGKLISPTVEEVGLLFKESIASWRFKNQVKILNKARRVCEENNISPKAISLKLLVPFLEGSSLEEDEYLQDKWAILLSNLVDSNQNIQNNVFPYILGQISKEEFIKLESSYKIELSRVDNLTATLQTIREEKIKESKSNPGKYTAMRLALESKEIETLNKIKEVGIIPNIGEYEDFEISNLVRLGIIESEKRFSAYTDGAEIENNRDESFLYFNNIEIDIQKDGEDFMFSSLGLIFMELCVEKRTRSDSDKN